MLQNVYIWVTVCAEFILTVVGAIVALHEEWAKLHRRLILSIFLIVGLGGVVTTLKTAQQSATASANLDASISQLSKSSAEIARVAALNTKLQEQLLVQSSQIVGLSKQAINSVTGGDSFAYISFTDFQQGVARICAIHAGKFPLHNVSARVPDVNRFKEMVAQHVPLNKSNISDVILNIGDISANATIDVGALPLRTGDHQDFNVFFYAQNGFWKQLIRLRWLMNHWVVATRVVGGNGRKVLYEYVDPAFPLKNRKVDWD
jgi:hypothetical protein